MLQQGRLSHVTAGRQINRRKLKGKEEELGVVIPPSSPWMKVTLGRSQPDYSQPWESRKDACVRPLFPCPTSHVQSSLFLIKSEGPRWVAGFALPETDLELFQLGGVHSTCCPGKLTHTQWSGYSPLNCTRISIHINEKWEESNIKLYQLGRRALSCTKQIKHTLPTWAP